MDSNRSIIVDSTSFVTTHSFATLFDNESTTFVTLSSTVATSQTTTPGLTNIFLDYFKKLARLFFKRKFMFFKTVKLFETIASKICNLIP